LAGGVDRLTEHVGGPARRRVVLLLACVLSLDAADQGAIGAVAPDLTRSLHISNIELGLLVTLTSLVGAFATLPMGNLVDRVPRVRLVAGAIVLWGFTELAGAFSVNYGMLLVTRIGLGAVTAVAAPAVASLTGDLFPPGERGRIYGFVVTGELVGAGVGVLVAGLVAGWLGWRPALGILALPSLVLAWALCRWFPEPARGGRSWIVRGAEAIPSTEEAPREDGRREAERQARADDDVKPVRELVDRMGVEPNEEIVVEADPGGWTLREAVRYVLRVRTNVVMIVASSLGYFFFAGLKTFAVLFARGHYGLSQGVATLLVVVLGGAAAVGVIVGGRVSDRFIAKGRVTSRLDVGVLGYSGAALLLVPALLAGGIGIALPLLMFAAAGLAAPNATLDAARLDVVPAQLWGRAESVRTAVRTLLEAAAPLVFGFVSEQFGANKGGFGIVAGGAKSPAGTPAQVHGLEIAFLLMLVPLAASGLMLLLARKAYPVDVASAEESQRRAAPARKGR
jgi:MFS family permease